MSRAGLALALALATHALWPETSPVAACPEPGEYEARAGHTSVVSCEAREPLRGPVRLLYGLRLDVNRADAASLTALPGIGPVRAEALVAARAQGAFCSPEDLERVRGIGPVTAARLAPHLDFPCSG